MKTIISGKEVSQQMSEDLKSKISGLAKSQVLAVNMRNASTDDSKVVTEFAEKINLSNQPQNALVAFNPGDDRFSSGARRTWVTMDRAYAEKMFGATIGDEGFVELGQVLKSFNDGTQEFRIRVREFLESQLTDTQREYIDNYLKIIPSTGAYFIDNETGERVCSTTDLLIVDKVQDPATGAWVSGETPHILTEGEYKVPGTSNAGASSVLQNAGVSQKLVS